MSLIYQHPFNWERVRLNPKAEHGVICAREDWFKTMTYRLLDSNGFLLLHTLRGRVYWMSQNATNHTTPDWKLHFSVCEEDIPKAWNILAQLFIERKCEIGMKATTVAAKFCKSSQRGRELTVYIYQYSPALKSGVMYESSSDSELESFIGEDTSLLQPDWPDIAKLTGHITDPNSLFEYESDFYLGPEIDAPYDAKFWKELIVTAEQRLHAAGIRNNGGVADGDLPLPHCYYTSLRNEAFVVEYDRPLQPVSIIQDARHGTVIIGSNKPQLQYPSNKAGWNAARHKNPLEETIYMLLLEPIIK